MKKLWMILGIIALGFVTSVTGAVLGVVLLTSILFLALVVMIPVMIMFVYLLNYVRKEAEKRGIGAMVFIPCACVPPFIVSICMLLWITTDPPVSTAMGYDNLARWIAIASFFGAALFQLIGMVVAVANGEKGHVSDYSDEYDDFY